MPFDDNQIRDFARKWYIWLEKHLHREKYSLEIAKKDADQFESDLFSQPQITELARNPLMLSMIAVVVRQGKKLPERRVELYDQALKALMTDWERLRGQKQTAFKVDYGEACQLWAPVARWMHEVGTGAVHEDELKIRIKTRLQELELKETADEWLTVRGDKCCLLQERGKHIFGFLHQTFQEYLAAMDICSEGVFVPELSSYIEDPRWHEVLRLACGYLGIITRPPQKKNVTNLLRFILTQKSPFEFILYRDLLLAGSCIADAVNPRTDVESEIVMELLSLAASDVVDGIAIAAMGLILANSRVEVDTDDICKFDSILSRHPNWNVRFLFLKWVHERQGMFPDALVEELIADSDPDVRCLAATWCWKRDRKIKHLYVILESLSEIEDVFDEEENRGETGRIAMSIIGNETGALFACLSAADVFVRIHASYLLLKTNYRPQALETLSTISEHAENDYWGVCTSLLMETEEREKVIACTVAFLVNSNETISMHSAQLLSQEDIPVGTLLTILDYVKACENYKPYLLKPLLELVLFQDPIIRARATSLLLQTEQRNKVTAYLMELLASLDPNTRLLAATYLIEAQLNEPAIAALISLLHQADKGVWPRTIELLILQKRYKEVIPFIADALDLCQSDTFIDSLLKLTIYKVSSSDLTYLIRLLDYPNDEIRGMAAYILVKTAASKQAIQTLIYLCTLMPLSQNVYRLRSSHINPLSLLITTEASDVAMNFIVNSILSKEMPSYQLLEYLQPPILLQKYPSQIAELLRNNDSFVRRTIAYALRETHYDSAVLPIAQEALSSQNLQGLDHIKPDHVLYESAWLYATLVTRQGQLTDDMPVFL